MLNYCDESVPFTRITEHKHFAPWERDTFDGTICYREFSRSCGPSDIPYYPIRQTDEETMLQKYVARRARPTASASSAASARTGTWTWM